MNHYNGIISHPHKKVEFAENILNYDRLTSESSCSVTPFLLYFELQMHIMREDVHPVDTLSHAHAREPWQRAEVPVREVFQVLQEIRPPHQTHGLSQGREVSELIHNQDRFSSFEI